MAQRTRRARLKEYIDSLERDVQILRNYQEQSCDEVIFNLICRNNALEYEIRHLESMARSTPTQCEVQSSASGSVGPSTVSFGAGVLGGGKCEFVPLSTEYMEHFVGFSGKTMASDFQVQCFPTFGEKLVGRTSSMDSRLLLYPPAS